MNNFYYPKLQKDSLSVELDGSEAKHMVGARRLKPNDEVSLFNGKGLVAQGEIESVSAKNVLIRLNQVNQLKLPNPRIALASAIPKGDRFSVLLDMATQLGMTDFIPLDCERSVVTNIGNKLERYQRICIGACKQSQRYYVPTFHLPMTPAQLIKEDGWSNETFVLADPKANSEDEDLTADFDSKVIVLIVGPEGGFSENELNLFDQKNVKRVKLSGAILRIEAACVSFLAKINHRQIC